MQKFRFFLLFLLISTLAYNRPADTLVPEPEHSHTDIKGALLGTRISSFEELKKIVQIEYFNSPNRSKGVISGNPKVTVTHTCNGRQVTSILTTGVSEADFVQARDGGFWDRIWLAANSPYAVINRSDMQKVAILARRRWIYFGEGDPAFYDLALKMNENISPYDKDRLSEKDLGEKGFINTFNHITAQAFMTSIFSETFADFMADAHERKHMPQLITGDFTPEMIADLETEQLPHR